MVGVVRRWCRCLLALQLTCGWEGWGKVSRKERLGKVWGRVSLLSYLVVRFCSLSLSQLLSAHKCAPPSIIHIDVAGLENGTTISTACDFPAAKEGIILIHSISAVPRYCFFFLLVCLRYWMRKQNATDGRDGDTEALGQSLLRVHFCKIVIDFSALPFILKDSSFFFTSFLCGRRDFHSALGGRRTRVYFNPPPPASTG